eukprot:TRINITY_DN15232_c0_g2_i1.p4 TRINITY_DN15232_c0_g2~~TRINITY_DN15232_c0_g2_i1.p4  ORF type:complete len:100 (-),score=0.19 TRINITY_DN15232_c0_g2_i1:73-372(-)
MYTPFRILMERIPMQTPKNILQSTNLKTPSGPNNKPVRLYQDNRSLHSPQSSCTLLTYIRSYHSIFQKPSKDRKIPDRRNKLVRPYSDTARSAFFCSLC